MSADPRIPIGRIQSNIGRRAAMCFVFPALIAFHYFLPLVLLPLAIVARVSLEGAHEAREVFREIAAISRRDSRILALAWRTMWAEPLDDR